jgi:hypothetical protein
LKFSRRDFLKLAVAGAVAAGASGLPQASPAAASGPVSRCLWLSWDGADWRSVTGLMGQGLLPNLSRLNVVRMIASPNTATKAGHSEVITGQGCDRTNVITNKRYNSDIQAEWTAFYRVRKAHPRWFISSIMSKRDHTGDHLIHDGQAGINRKQPWFHFKTWAKAGGMSRYFNPSMTPLAETGKDMTLDYTTGRFTEDIDTYLASGAPGFLIYCHWAQPDHTGHQHGMGSPEWNADLVKLDAILGWAIGELQPEAVFLYSDHGFDDFGAKQHLDAPEAMLASNLPLTSDGLRWDVAYTVLSTLGLPVQTFEPRLRGRDLRLT